MKKLKLGGFHVTWNISFPPKRIFYPLIPLIIFPNSMTKLLLHYANPCSWYPKTRDFKTVFEFYIFSVLILHNRILKISALYLKRINKNYNFQWICFLKFVKIVPDVTDIKFWFFKNSWTIINKLLSLLFKP